MLNKEFLMVGNEELEPALSISDSTPPASIDDGKA